MSLFSPPACLPEFDLIPSLAQSWSDYIDLAMQTEVTSLEGGAFDPLDCSRFDSALGPENAWFYNPQRPQRRFKDKLSSDFIEVDIAWTGFPRQHLIRSKNAPFPPAEEIFVRDDGFVDKDKRPITSLLSRNQDEYLEWRAEYDTESRLTQVTFTCEAPEYWAAFSDGVPPPYFSGPSRDLAIDPAGRALFLETYRSLVGRPVRMEDLIFDRDIYAMEAPHCGLPSQPVLKFAQGAYNPWNRWNTTDGIVHLTHPANTLRAEINLAARATLVRMKRSSAPGGIRIVTDTSELICASGFGSPNRFSDPTIGARINELVRNGYAITLADPVGLYIGDVDVSGWTEPGPNGKRRPVNKEDYFQIIRPEPDEARRQGRILRLVCKVPSRRRFTLPGGSRPTLSDLEINGEPLVFGGQIAACITMKLTGRAIFFRKPTDSDLMHLVHKCFRCKDNPDDLSVVNQDDTSAQWAAKLGADSPCNGGFVAAFPNDPPDEAGLLPVGTASETSVPAATGTVGGAAPAVTAPAGTATAANATRDDLEPPLAMSEIQGNILSGFNKDYQNFLFFRITDREAARNWFRSILPKISFESEVYPFNKAFRERRTKDGVDPPDMKAEWLNIAFSYPGLLQFTDEAQQFQDAAFIHGLPERSAGLGDPVSPSAKGHPRKWVVGGPGKIPDFVLLVAADDIDQLKKWTREVTRGKKGVILLHQDKGRARTDAAERGREHFGFKDGVSQPGIRGRAQVNPVEFLTLRKMPLGHSRENDFGRPGQPLICPGQFVFGYPTQSDVPTLPGPPATAGPKWAENGSFLVYRRLNQHVDVFWKTMNRLAGAFPPVGGVADSVGLAAKLIGRWPDGTPLLRSPAPPPPSITKDDTANNFDFMDNGYADLDGCAPPQDDPLGGVCPFASHIRKVNPRDEVTDIGDTGATLRRRILRRGLIFGPPVTEPNNVRDDEIQQERGLLFLCYQTSIVDQFEFLMSRWVNSSLRPKSGGRDIVVGQDGQGAPRKAPITLTNVTGDVATDATFVTPTGGGYFFAPSRSALRDVIIK